MQPRYPILFLPALAALLRVPLPAFPLARRRSNARPSALSHPPLLRLDRPLTLHHAQRRSPNRRAVSHHNPAGPVRGPQPQSVPSRQAAQVPPAPLIPASKSWPGKSILRSPSGKSPAPPLGSPSRSGDCTPEWPSSEPLDLARPWPACARSWSRFCPGRRTVARTIWKGSGNGIRSMTPCSIPACSPAPSRS